MIALDIRSNLSRMDRGLTRLAHEQVPFAAARALNDCARAASVAVNRAMPDIFSRPTSFTRHAVVAPRELSAQKDRLAAIVTLRPIQARYLLKEETGGTRTPADNTHRTGAQAIVLPGRGLLLDSHGNIPAGAIARIKRKISAQAAHDTASRARHRTIKAVAARDRGVFYIGKDGGRSGSMAGGFYQRLPGHRIVKLISFGNEAHYKPRLGYHDKVGGAVSPMWTGAFVKRLHEAIATAR